MGLRDLVRQCVRLFEDLSAESSVGVTRLTRQGPARNVATAGRINGHSVFAGVEWQHFVLQERSEFVDGHEKA